MNLRMGCVLKWQVTIVTVLLFIKGLHSRPEGYNTEMNFLCRGENKFPGLLSVPYDCSGYVQCNYRYALWRNCPGNLVFHQDAKGCKAPPETGPCRDPKLRAEMFCPTKPDLKFPHPKSCAMYYDCSQDVAQMGLARYENECRYPKLFDKIDLVCKPPEEVLDCGFIPKPTTKCNYQLECIDKACKGHPDGLNPMANKLFQPDYMICKDQLVLDKLTCPEGQVFDPVLFECSSNILASMTKTCKDVPMLKIPSHLSCAKYYDCMKPDWHANWQPYLTECPYFQLFDPLRRQCTAYSNVNCEKRPEPKAPCDYDIGHCSSGTCIPCEASCLGENDGSILYPGTNNRYIVCQKERTTRIENCPGTRLFWQGTCRRKAEVPKDAFSTTTTPTPTTSKTTTTLTPPTSTNTTTAKSQPDPPTTTATTTKATTKETTTQPSTLTTTLATTASTTAKADSACDPATQNCSLDGRLTSLEEQLRSATKCNAPPKLDNLDGVAVTLTYQTKKTIASYTCKKGYTVCGVRTSVTCRDGVWDQPALKCVQTSWGPPLVPRVVPVKCPLKPWTVIHFKGMLQQYGPAAFALKGPDVTKQITVSLTPQMSSSSYLLEIRSGQSVVSTKEMLYYPGDSLEIDIVIGMDGYVLSLTGEPDMIIPFMDGASTVHSIEMEDSLLGNTLEIIPSKVTQLFTRMEFEDSYKTEDNTFLTFGVQSCEDVLIHFSPLTTLSYQDSIRLNIGRKSNTETTVKMCRTCDTYRVQHSPLDCKQMKPFWIKLTMGETGTSVTIGNGFGMDPSTVLFSSLPYPANNLGIQSVYLASKSPASWAMSHPVIERCGIPPPILTGVPVISDSMETIHYTCPDDKTFCGPSDTMTCSPDGQWSGLWGACVKSVYTSITTSSVDERLGCRFGENSAISIHVTKGPSDIEIKLRQGTDVHLQVSLLELRRLFGANISGISVPGPTVDGSRLEPGKEYHIVIYNSKNSFKLYVEGKPEGTFAHKADPSLINHFNIGKYQQLSRVEFVPKVAADTCGDLPSLPNADVINAVSPQQTDVASSVTIDKTLGAKHQYTCKTNYVYCGNSHMIMCSSHGTWKNPDGHCIQNAWTLSSILTEDKMFNIPHCFAHSGDIDIDVQLLIDQNGTEFKVELHYEEQEQVTHRLHVDVTNGKLTIHPGAVIVSVPTTVTTTSFQLVISEGAVHYFRERTKIGTAVVSFPKSSFHAIVVSKGGATLSSVKMQQAVP